MLVRFAAAAALLLCCGISSHAQASRVSVIPSQSSRIGVVPRPVQLEVTPGGGRFTITRRTPIVVSAETDSLGRFLSRMLAPAFGFRLRVVRDSAPANARPIVLGIDDALRQLLGAEGYELEVTSASIQIRAAALAG
ncbi:MAG: glycoside hydrolase family 20 zincin-like fold domain-containing protein, partial [Gemmatimonadaceae bacterium]